MPDFNHLMSVISEACGSEVKTDETTTPKSVIIAASRIVDVCTALQTDASCYFDMLSCLTAVDNGPEAGAMEVIYNLYSIPFNTHLMLRVGVPRDNAEVPSLAALYKTADWHEREAFDLFGVRFIGHPDMRRILLPADWEGHPLRKDYKHQEYYRGVQVAYGEGSNVGVQYEFRKDNLLRSEPNSLQVDDLAEEEMIINLGPQHPSTHGVLRLEVLLEGEVVKKVVPHIGYLHRCFEKHAENLPYNQIIPFVDRCDYVTAMNNEHIFAMGVERMLGIQDRIPKRIEYIRVLMAELNRIASHLIAIGTYGMDIGSFTPFFWIMRDREHILRLLEWASGARLLYNYIWIGGLYYDLPIGFEERCVEFVRYFRPKLTELEIVLVENKIFVDRTANVGALPLDLAINCGATGPVLRGSGLRYDLRKVDGYSVYPELEFSVPVGEGKMGTVGDCWDRTWVRLEEIYQSLRLVEQCADRLLGDHRRTPEFDPQGLVPKKIRPPKQDLYVRGEMPKGELGFFFRADGRSDIPFRCKCRSASFVNLSVLPEISKGVLIADLIAILGSIDIVLGEVDR